MCAIAAVFPTVFIPQNLQIPSVTRIRGGECVVEQDLQRPLPHEDGELAVAGKGRGLARATYSEWTPDVAK